MFCKYCGKDISVSGVCSCEGAAGEKKTVDGVPSTASEQAQEGQDLFVQRVNLIAKVFGHKKFMWAGILLVLFAILNSIFFFSLLSLLNIIPIMFGILIIVFSIQTKENTFQISGEDTLKRAHLASLVFMVISIVCILAAIFFPIIFTDQVIDLMLSTPEGQEIMLESYQEFESAPGEEIVIDENNKEQILSSSDFREYLKLSVTLAFTIVALTVLVYASFMLSLKKTIKSLKEELTSKEWPPILKLGTTGFLNFFGGFFTVTALLNWENIELAICFACLAAPMFMIAHTFKEYNNERVLLTQQVLVQDRSQNLEKSSH